MYFIFIHFYILRCYTFQISINLSIYHRNMLFEQFINSKKLCWRCVSKTYYSERYGPGVLVTEPIARVTTPSFSRTCPLFETEHLLSCYICITADVRRIVPHMVHICRAKDTNLRQKWFPRPSNPCSLVFSSNLLRLRIFECPVAILALVRAVNNESCLDLCNKTNKRTCIQYALSHIINCQYVSIAFATILRVAVEESWEWNKIPNCISGTIQNCNRCLETLQKLSAYILFSIIKNK